MELKTAFEEMEVVLNKLNEQFETLKKNETRAPQIEIDIIMASMRKLYECMSSLNKYRQVSSSETREEIIESVEAVLIEDTLKIETEEHVSKEPEVEKEEEITEIATTFEEDLSYEKVTKDFLEEIDDLEEKARSEFEEVDVEAVQPDLQLETPKKDKPKSSLLLQFEDEMFSVNESVAQKGEDKSIVNKLSNKRIENLKSAIGINDKFYFINELFSGNSQVYEDVIYALNNFKRYKEAMQYVSTLKYRYEWNMEAEAYQKLVHFLERKFMEVQA